MRALSCRGRGQAAVERHQLRAGRAGNPQIAGVIGGQPRRFRELQNGRVLDGDGLNPKPLRLPIGGAQYFALARIETDLNEADVRQLIVQQGRRGQPGSRQTLGDRVGLGLRENQRGSAEASTTLTSVTIGSYDGRRLGGGAQTESPHRLQICSILNL